MKIVNEILSGCYLIEPKHFIDERGGFTKTYEANIYKSLGLMIDIREEFYSVSHRNVVRGMHFQIPPYDHDKVVYCTNGSVTDVLLDLRKGVNFGRVASVELSCKNRMIVFVPKGIAHGFVARTDNALVLYKTSSVYVPNADSGIRWDSFGFNWNVENPIMSLRDQLHLKLEEFQTVF